MSSKKRIAIVVAILIGALLVSLAVNLIITLVQKSEHPKKYEEYVEKYASEYNVPEYIIYAIIATESGFDPEAKSSAGALGLMQMTKSTFKYLSSDAHFDEDIEFEALFDPETAIRYGTYYLRYLFNKFHKWNVAFAAYNAGEGQVLEWLDDTRYSKDGENLSKIPIKETRIYVKKVNKAISYYKDTYYRNGVSVK
jgi:soluble lytic murein transglycosylase